MDDGSLVIESAAVSTGKASWSWHIGDYTNLFGDLAAVNRLLQDLLNRLIRININQNKRLNSNSKKWDPTIVYVHNFSGFDSISLIRFLALNATTFNINRRYGIVISIVVIKKVVVGGVEYNAHLIFRDSYLLLNTSLAKIAVTFGTTLR